MRVLCVDNFGGDGALDLCLRAQADGHQVKWFFSKSDRTENFGKGLVETVPDWRDWMRWADLVILADNTKYLREIDSWRKERGIKVIGATAESASWELNRTLGQQVLKKAGIPVPAYKEFTDYDAAIAFVKREMRRFVSKPCGDEPDKSLSYVAKSPEDLIYMLERWKKAQKLKGAFILQDFIPGVEMAVGAWIGPKGFLPGWCENWEEKKLMAGGCGPNCFTPDAEVLTKAGWKAWPDVTMHDELCSLRDGKIVYDRPSRLIVQDYAGELLGWQSPTLDILVTPDHQMYVQDDHYRRPMFFESAAHAFDKRRTVMRAGGEWIAEGDDKEAAWAALVGIHIADGYCKDRSIVFGNCPPHKQAAFTKIAAAAGYFAKMYGKDLYINSKFLADTFRSFGPAQSKYVPQYIKDASTKVIHAFLQGYEAGDGASRHNNLVYTTISKRLSDDLCELALKVGWASSIRVRDRRGEMHLVDGYECHNRHIAYDIGIAREKTKSEISPDIRYTEQYKGRVYCCTVPSHVIYVRRNGKPCWISQCGEMGTVLRYVESSRLARKVLAPLEEAIVRTGHTGYVDVNCIIDDKGHAWPLEFTMRPGWPTFNIQAALHKGDSIEWLAALADGQNLPPFRLNEIAVGVVMACGDFPVSHMTRREVTGIPIYGMSARNRDAIHFCEVMQGEAPKEANGKIVTTPAIVTAGDYLLVATGTDESVRKAKDKAYRVVKSLTIPSSPFWRNDIGTRLRTDLPELQKHGFAATTQY